MNFPVIVKDTLGAGSIGVEVMNAYEEAVKERYRFFSFGDAMCIV